MSQSIPIRNLYHLLSYAWDVLPQASLVDLDSEHEAHPVDLLAEVLIKGTNHLLRRGIDQDYQLNEEVISTLRGRVDFAYSERRMLLQQGQALCLFDEMTADTLSNQILKATFTRLYRTWGLEKGLRKQCGTLIRRFSTVATISIQPSHFSKVSSNRNNSFYRFLLSTCELIHSECFPEEGSGNYQFRDFFRDEGKMPKLYEKFIFNFYKKKQSAYQVSSERISWNATSTTDPELKYLPSMLTDISLRSSERTIVIDAKYYKKTFSTYFDKEKIHSNNLYQIFAYLKNMEVNRGNDSEAEGILLYPVTGKEAAFEYEIGDKIIRIETLNLTEEWGDIETRLLSLIL